jgi:hypothetical protein
MMIARVIPRKMGSVIVKGRGKQQQQQAIRPRLTKQPAAQ